MKPAFPYIWSNPDAPRAALLANALLRPDFDDLVHLTLHYGADALGQALADLVAAGYVRGSARTELERVLRNIRIGVERARAQQIADQLPASTRIPPDAE